MITSTLAQINPNAGDGLEAALAAALTARSTHFDPRHETAFRLFNGFYEGFPTLVADLYGGTLILHNYADPPEKAAGQIEMASEFYGNRLPWLNAVLIKARHAGTDEAKRGILLSGDTLDRHIQEDGVWYAIDLRLNQDSSFYLDTRHLREWIKANSAGKTVLNTFAYTGSLGVAARAGGTTRVVQLDLSRSFLNIGKDSYLRNGFPIHRGDFQSGDFWPQISHLKREGTRFDCVVVDPPIFSRTRHGIVDLVESGQRILNKVRPLIADGGTLVTINNALFVSGAAYLQMLETLCADGYLSIETLIPVPQDFMGYADADASNLPADPAPFNHPTKIAVLRVRRKDAG
ncbi:MAG: class I SAM-dependent methyltransferase [Janthinobacterium lividum]